jgi:hypothetical protein
VLPSHGAYPPREIGSSATAPKALKDNPALSRRASECHTLPKTDKCFHILSGVLQQVVRRAPLVRFAKHNDCRAAEAEDCLFLTPFERRTQRMNLCYPANRQGSDLDKSETSEVPGFKDVYVTLVGE